MGATGDQVTIQSARQSRRRLLLTVAAATGSACAWPFARVFGQPAADAEAPAVPPPQAAAPEDPGPKYAMPTTLDRSGRILAPVWIGQHGPLRFIVDTGANRSAIAERTAARIGAVATGQTLVHGITGSAVMPQLEIPSVRVGELSFERQRLAILPDAVFGLADGIIGVDTLQTARVDINFQHDVVTVRRSQRERPKDRLIVRATLKHRGLLLIPGRVGRVPVKAIVDTGAERSLGNEALFAKLTDRARSPSLAGIADVVGATAQVVQGKRMLAPVIDLGGGARIGALTVTFGDFHVFKVWELLDAPALVLGMDVLGTLSEFSVDYPRREFQVRVDRRRPPVDTHFDVGS